MLDLTLRNQSQKIVQLHENVRSTIVQCSEVLCRVKCKCAHVLAFTNHVHIFRHGLLKFSPFLPISSGLSK